MQEQIISIETAKLAKVKGFEIPTPRYYLPDGKLISNTKESYGETEYCFDVDDFSENWNQKGLSVVIDDNNYFNPKTSEAYSAPTQSLLHDWLMETHKLFVDVTVQQFGYGFLFAIIDLSKLKCVKDLQGGPDYKYSHKGAFEAGLFEALKLIQL